jgi:amino acid transporter
VSTLAFAGVVVACLISLVALAGIAIAMAFFIGVIGYGWMRTIAPKEELEALPPDRRRWVTVRAGIGAALLWVLLLTANKPAKGGHMSGDEVFAFFYRLLRRFAGLPPEPPPSLAGMDPPAGDT